MSGGGGAGSFYSPSSDSVQKKLERAREKEQERLKKDIDGYLKELLVEFNTRDVEVRRGKLEALRDLLGQKVEVEAILLAGSVGKHTEVSGLSDVDALVILEREAHKGESPKDLLGEFGRLLNRELPRTEVKNIRQGRVAVTVTYRDGTEVQLLPALRRGETVSIPKADAVGWKETRPRAFQDKLSKANEGLNHVLIPTIKLVKAIVDGFPEQRRLSGYHIESLAIDAAKSYQGPKTTRSVMLHVLDHASKRVLRPMGDVTGQSRWLDEDLGKADSVQRLNTSQALAAVKRRLESATSLGQWKGTFEEKQ